MDEPNGDILDRAVPECLVQFLPGATEACRDVLLLRRPQQPADCLVQAAGFASRRGCLIGRRLITLRDDDTTAVPVDINYVA